MVDTSSSLALTDRPPPAALVTVAAIVLAGCGLAVTLSGSLGLVIAGVASALGLAVWLALAKPVILLLTFAMLLPLHLLALVLLFNAGVDHQAIRVFSLWKELAALFLLGIVVLRQVVSGRLFRLRPLDALVLLFLGLNLAYLLMPVFAPFVPPLSVRVQGFRDNSFFVVLYFIGRLVAVSVSELRLVFAAVLGVGVAGALAGVFERLFLPLEFFFEPLRFDDFNRDYLNLHYYTGLPFNFWTSVGTFRRGVSFHLGSHHFAMAAALLFPLVVGLRRPLRCFPEALRGVLLGICTIGLMLPLTRSVILACLIQVLVLGVALRRPHYALTAVLCVALVLGISLAFLDLGGYFSSVARAAPGSSVESHVESWQDTAEIVRNYPMGVGFGVADTAAERTGTAGVGSGLTGEGEYAFYVATIGVPGLLLFVVLQAAVAWMLLRAWQSGSGPALRNLALITLAMFLGAVIVGSFTQVRHVPAFYYPLWWLVGLVARGGLEGDRETPTAG